MVEMLNTHFVKKIGLANLQLAKEKAKVVQFGADNYLRNLYSKMVVQRQKEVDGCKMELVAANKAAEFATSFAKQSNQNPIAGCRLVLTGDRPGIYGSNGRWLCSPLFVESRARVGNHFITRVRLLTPDNSWVIVNVPADELNDHGAKLRGRLLAAGANIAVETILRRELLRFILNCPSAEDLNWSNEQFDLPEWLTGATS